MSYKESSVVTKATMAITDRVRAIVGGVSASISLTDFGTAITDTLVAAGFIRTADLPVAVSRLRTTTTLTGPQTYTLLSTDDVLICNTTSGAITVNLPVSGISNGQTFTFKRNSSANHDVNIIPAGGHNIDGDTGGYVLLALSRSHVEIMKLNAVWQITGS